MRRIVFTAAATVFAARLLSAAALPVSPPQSTTLAETLQQDNWDTFTMEVTHRDSQVSPEGKPAGRFHEQKYRWDRTQIGDRWKTVISVGDYTRRYARSVKGTQHELPGPKVGHIEDEGDGRPLRFFDRRGQPMMSFQDASKELGFEAPALGLHQVRQSQRGRSWIDNLIIQPQHTARRRAGIERAFGAAHGRVRALDRFVRQRGGLTTEMLVDPALAIPVEVNTLSNGVLQSHQRIEYSREASGVLLKRGQRVEFKAREGDANRDVVEVFIDNVRLERRGGGR